MIKASTALHLTNNNRLPQQPNILPIKDYYVKVVLWVSNQIYWNVRNASVWDCRGVLID